MLLISIAIGVREDIGGQVRDIGVNVLVVIPGRISEGTFNPNMAGQSYLLAKDADELAKVAGVVRTAPFTFVGGGLRAGSKGSSSMLVATTPAWFAMHQTKLAEGRLLGAEDQNADRCLIGSVAKRELFGDRSAVGRSVTVNGRKYQVVGVTVDTKSSNSMFSMGGLENLVYLPYHRMTQFIPDMQTDRIMIQTSPEVEPKALIRELEAVLAKRLDRLQFQVLTQEDLLGLVYKVMGVLTWLLTGLTSIALFVGGIMIMAVMLMSVGERTKEIGIRKTVGARGSDVFVQFLGEAVLIALLGGAVGLALSYVVCLGLAHWTPIKPLVTISTIGLDLVVSLTVGSVFGLIPAMSAAKMQPVVAMRHE